MSSQQHSDAIASQPRDTLLDQTYPPQLEQAELRLIGLRRNAQANPLTPPNLTGLAISGGGIRSATFGLGVLQSLARHGLLGGFDYLSTVSGGGYAGSFLTRLYSRCYIHGVADVAARLRSDRPPPAPGQPDPVEFLRENSRYLAPKAGGDLLLDAVVVLRNWIALQVVLTSFFLMLMVGQQTLRVLFDLELQPLQALDTLHGVEKLLLKPQYWLDSLGGDAIHWSPWVNTLLPWWFCVLLPLGWVYWLIGYLSGPEQPDLPRGGPAMSRMRRLSQGMDSAVRWTANNLWRAEIHPLWGFFSVVAVHLAILWLGLGNDKLHTFSRCSLVVCAITFALYLVFLVRYAVVNGNGHGRLRQAVCDFITALLPFNPVRDKLRIQRDARARNAASSLLALAFSVWLALIMLSLVDSFGQTLYVRWAEGSTNKPLSVGALFAAVVALGTRLGNVTGFLSRVTAKLGAGASFTAFSGLAAWLLIVVVLSGADAISQGIAWKYAAPAEMPQASSSTVAAPPAATAVAANLASTAALTAAATSGDAPAAATPPPLRARRFRHHEPGDLCFCLLALGGLFAFSIMFGRAWPFLNRSSQHPLYTDRLTRAYLGASNPKRAEPGRSSITDPIPGDDGLCSECWSDEVFLKGAPLHLLNTTANETASTHGKTVFRDRKGIGMAAGPCGLSAGARHHALFTRDGDRPDDGACQPLLPKSGGYCMFGDDAVKKPERLTLGGWMAISGAAFSTGMGYHTTFALSVLTGFANLRLGYWWDSGAVPPFRNSDRTLGRMLGHHVFHFLFPVQAYLLNELTASFHGPDEPHWYLSDGGSFENMGGYELIRRRLPLMLIVDGEEDPDYTFEGLANLVRKARMDFGAEIRFLTAEDIARLDMPPAIAACFGAPEALRPDEQGYSRAHAALASVRYAGAQRQSLLLYLKPSLMADVPADVREYQQKNKPFPQQPTANQFFDEAQWESYRRLGEYVADKVFAGSADAHGDGSPAWHPALLAWPPPGQPPKQPPEAPPEAPAAM